MQRLFTGSRFLLASIVLPLAILASPVLAQDKSVVSKRVGTGITLTQMKITTPAPLLVNLVTVDLSIPDVRIGAAVGKDVIYGDDAGLGKEAVSSMVARTGALVGVNADYFPMTWAGDPLGVCIVDGELASEPYGTRAAFAFTRDRKAVFDIPIADMEITTPNGQKRKLDGLNRSRNTGETILYTQRFGSSIKTKYAGTDVVLSSGDLPVVAGKTATFTVLEVKTKSLDTAITEGGAVLSGGGPSADFLAQNLKSGDAVTMRFGITSGRGIDWSSVTTAVGGGPLLVKGGVACVDGDAEGFSASLVNSKHPRTAVGTVGQDKLVLVTCDGRQPMSAGVSLEEFAQFLVGLGITDAMNLDGGGSTAMSIAGMLVNSPCEGSERLVANALLLFGKTHSYGEIPGMTLATDAPAFVAGKPVRMILSAGSPTAACAVDKQSSAIWGTRGGVGFVDQSGIFMPMKARKGTVSAMYGSQAAVLEVTVTPGDVAKVDIIATAKADEPAAWTITATARDVFGNSAPERTATVTATGCSVSVSSGTTDANGSFTFDVTATPEAKERKVSVKIDGVSSSSIL